MFNNEKPTGQGGLPNILLPDYSKSYNIINQINSNALSAAISLANEGIPSFPCTAKKSPACPGGFKAATANPEELKHLWINYPGSLVGVPTGLISGVDVMDIDLKGICWLEANASKLPLTCQHTTRSGGFHFLFRHRDGLRNSASKIAPGIDIRGDGGYIIWWPNTGLPVINSSILAEWPEWMIQKLLPAAKRFIYEAKTQGQSTKYAKAALYHAALKVACAASGERNSTLNSEAWSIGRFILTNELQPQEIASVLSSAALSTGLPRHEIIATIASALRARGV